ncbi:superoxide dismutase [Cu-Zn] [Monosporozyma unispora]|nr:Superoxide dismutase [Cu-Zn] [Kazachstania unispora]
MVKAVAILKGSQVSGIVNFEQSSENEPTTVHYEITGNDANALRGFHVHEWGDLSNGCVTAGPHFNPFKKTHGSLTSEVRHVGDMGNVQTDANGVAKGTLTDSLIKLIGPTSIIGRAVVIHAGQDDLGQGGDEESTKTGNAGGRAACGVIGLAQG